MLYNNSSSRSRVCQRVGGDVETDGRKADRAGRGEGQGGVQNVSRIEKRG